MKKCLLLLITFSLFAAEAEAQLSRYLVKLKNKAGTPYTFTNPSAYLSARAIARRTKYNIAIDSTDLPVTPAYLSQISSVPNVTVLNVSRWLNQLSIQTTDPNAINTINGFSFVESVTAFALRTTTTENGKPRNKFELEEPPVEAPGQRIQQTTANYFDYGTNPLNEMLLHNGEFLHNVGLRGQEMQITMLDAGFLNYTTLKAFDSVNINGQILSTWDFVARDASVAEDNSHGMMCFSTIAANIPGQFVGKAPKASFHLFRTEDAVGEYPIEEHNWVCGAERADSLGTDVISSSVGYYDFDSPSMNYTYNDMNGRTTIAARGATIGARKGMMIFCAVGNEGNRPWRFLVTPSDADSVVAVGAVSVAGVVGSFSSYGPSSDGQVKPDIVSVGVNSTYQNTNNTIATNGNGTSFACPNMAGLATCLWQGFPEFNSIKIIRTLQKAGNLFTAPNDRTGYGIPNMKSAFSDLLVQFATATSSVNSCNAVVNWTSKDVDAMKYEIERKVPGESVYSKVGELNPVAGKILTNHSYQFNNTLVSVNAGTVSYRIRQIIDTATASFAAVYIDTTEFVLAAGCFPTSTGGNPQTVTDKVFVQPNPVAGSDNATLIVETNYAVNNMPIAIFDMKGNRVLQIKSSKASGRKTIDLPVGILPAGKYVIKVYNSQKAIGTADLLKL
jgi:serine protease AprX